MMRNLILIAMLVTLGACTTTGMNKDERMKVDGGHLNAPVPQKTAMQQDIPPVVDQLPIVEPPKPAEKLQTFTVVATDLPANELLFALARDARLNLDIDPAISGNVSINAIDQTLPQILKRISRQIDLHYYIDGPNLVVERDLPFIRIYQVDYLNMSRETSSTIELSTEIASTGGSESVSSGGNNSSSTIKNTSNNKFWETLEANITAIVDTEDEKSAVILNRESGTITVSTTASAHATIQEFLDKVLNNVRKQVLIEATVVEVTLNDDFQAGVDWSYIAQGNGWSFTQSTLGGALGAAPFLSGTYSHSNSDRDITGAIKALDTFGDVSVMSSPKIMALNNQTSVLKVVDNTVYFNFDVNTTISDTGVANTTFNTTINTVPVGFVMNVTPFVTANNEVILNVRPSISRILKFVNDPNPALATAGVESQIPEIQVREMESVLRVADGDTAVIGGLMQDSVDENSAGLPGLHDVDGFGFLFGTQERAADKTELVIFLRPRVINSANLDSDLSDFKRYLAPKQLVEQEPSAENESE
jgi:general secretion pathway protein D